MPAASVRSIAYARPRPPRPPQRPPRPCRRRAGQIPGQQRVHPPPGGGEEAHPCRARLLGQRVERAQLALDGGQVEGLERRRQPPQVRGQPRLDVGQVDGGVLQPRGDPQPLGQVVRTPVHEQLRVEGVGQQAVVRGRLGQSHRLACERNGPGGVAAVDPGAGQRDRHPGPLRPGGPRVGLVQQRRHLAGEGAEAPARRERQRRPRHRLDVARLAGGVVGAQRVVRPPAAVHARSLELARPRAASHGRISVTARACSATRALSSRRCSRPTAR